MEVQTHLGTGLGDRSKVVDEVGLGHTNTSITNRERLVLLIRSDANEKFLASLENRGIGQG